ncbi:MAG: hypothetical protein L0Y56_11390 [Nitrospira sp.]|nr:hypothetical protein [Nitrospira sp.]
MMTKEEKAAALARIKSSSQPTGMHKAVFTSMNVARSPKPVPMQPTMKPKVTQFKRIGGKRGGSGRS